MAPGQSAALRGLYGDGLSTREAPPLPRPQPSRPRPQTPPTRPRSARRSHRGTDTPDSGFFDGEQEDDISQSELDQIATWEAEKADERRQRQEEQDAAETRAIEASRAQAEAETDEEDEMNRAIAASIATEKQAEEAEMIEYVMMQSKFEHEPATRERVEQEQATRRRDKRAAAARKREEKKKLDRAFRESILLQATAGWREEEAERQRGYNDAEEEEHQRGEAARSASKDRRSVVEEDGYRDSVKRDEAAASKDPRSDVAQKVIASKVLFEAPDNAHEGTDPVVRSTFPEFPQPAGPPSTAMAGVGSGNVRHESNSVIRSGVPPTPIVSSQNPHTSPRQVQKEDRAIQTSADVHVIPFADSITSDVEPVVGEFQETGEQFDLESGAVTRQWTPLPAPAPRRLEAPDWMTYRPPSVVSSSGSTLDMPAQIGFVNGDVPSSALAGNSIGQAATSNPPQIPQPPSVTNNTYNGSVTGSVTGTVTGPVTINHHHHYNVTMPLTVTERKEKSSNLLKRAVHGYQRFRGKESGESSDAGSTSSQAQSLVSKVLSSLENLDIRGDRYVTNAKMTPSPIDEGYDSPARTETPDGNAALLAGLREVSARLQTPDQTTYQPSRSDENGSPASFRYPALCLVTSRSQASSVVPARRPLPSSNASSLYEDARDTVGPQESPNQNRELGVPSVNSYQEVPSRPSTPGTARFAQNEQLSQRLLSAADQSQPQAPHYLRKPEPDVELCAADPSTYEQYPVAIPDADRHGNDTPLSTFAEPDGPEYQQNALVRRHNPPRVSDWANVPVPHENLAYTNSRAMMGVDRFGSDSQTQMPALPAVASDRENVVRRKATPNSRAKEAEKEAQRSMRSKM